MTNPLTCIVYILYILNCYNAPWGVVDGGTDVTVIAFITHCDCLHKGEREPTLRGPPPCTSGRGRPNSALCC